MLIFNIQYVFKYDKIKKDLQFMIIITKYVESTIYQPLTFYEMYHLYVIAVCSKN